VKRVPRIPAGLQLVLSCEHASPAVPTELHGLGLPARLLRSHRSFDAGALPIAERLAAAWQLPLLAGNWSRLVVDLNRSADHPGVILRRVDGLPVPGNVALDAAARQRRLATFWQPYREELRTAVQLALRKGPVLHLSVHSFTERLGGVERRNDVGLLVDPKRSREVAVVAMLRRALAADGWSVRQNFPYFGHTDGVTTWLRREFGPLRYLGIEVECNQRCSRKVAGQRLLAAALQRAIATVLPVALACPR
jgi:predicted N-formylglutamate amidohydrolase